MQVEKTLSGKRIGASKAIRQPPLAPAGQSGQLAALIFAGALAMLPGTAIAQDATWSGATSGDLSDPANWVGGVAPTGVASFGASSQTALSSSSQGILLMQGWTFDAGAPNYTYNVDVPTYLQGVGIVNNGSGTVTLNNSTSSLIFAQAATAGNAVINNSGNGLVSFNSGALAGTATLNNLASTASIDFSSSHLGQATILNDGTLYILSSHAENASIINNGIVNFGSAATGDDATIENNAGGVVNFAGTSTGGNAVITNNTGALVDFSASSGSNGDNKLSIGNIIGDGSVYLGGNALSIGGSQNITLSGVFSDCGATGNDCQNAGATGGSLVKTGTGTLTIANTNSYTGGTTVSAGKLQLGDATTAGGLVGNVTVASGATFSVVNSNGYLSVRQIDNAGVTEFHGNTMPAYAVITNAAGGVVDFSDSAGYAGDGQISVQGLAGAGNFYLGGNTLTLDQNGLSTTVSGVISDCGAGGTACNTPGATGGALVIHGNQLTLTGANTYTGGTSVDVGSLTLGDAATRGSIVGDVTVASGALYLVNTDLSGVGTIGNAGITYFRNGTNADNIALNNSGYVVFQDTSSAGDAAIANSNHLSFTGNATAGNAAITNNPGGTVDFSASSGPNGDHRLSAGSIAGAGDFILGANTLTVGGNNNSTTVDGVISGTGGSLIKTGSGTLTLSGANTYTGATTVSAGTLRAGAASAFGGNSAAAVNAGATLDLNDYSQNIGSLAGAGNVTLGGSGTTVLDIGGDNTSTTFSGIISGGGGLNKSGTGTLILNGVNTYTGATTVSGGALEVGGIGTPTASIASDVTVGAAGTLRGHGSIAGMVANNGTLAPGGSIGTLTIAGNYTQSGAAALAIEVSPTNASKLVVNGAATLGGTLAITYDPGTYTAKTYTLVQANSISGAFSAVTETGKTNIGSLASTVSATGTTVDLALTGSNAIVAPTQTGIYSALGTSALFGAQSANIALLDRLGAAPASGFSVDPWATLTGSHTSVSGNGTTPGFQSQHYGFLGGHDKTLDNGTTVGLAFGYDHGTLSQRNEPSSGRSDTARVAVYGRRAVGPVSLSAALGTGLDWLTQKRRFATGTAQGDYLGQEITAGVQAALPLHFNDVATLTPKLGLRYAYFHANGFSESGAGGQDLNVSSNNAQSLQPYVGLALDCNFGNGNQGKPTATVQARVGYAYETRDTHRGLSVVAQDGTPFAVSGTALPRSYLTAGLGVTLHAAKNLDISLNYDALINTNHASSQQGSLNVVYRF